MLKLKPGVRLDGLRPEIIPAIIAAETTYALYDAPLVLTSVTDGKHGARSFHYSGLAFDARTSEVTRTEAAQIAESLREALGTCYDVVLEADHLHVEYDPKPRAQEPPTKVT